MFAKSFSFFPCLWYNYMRSKTLTIVDEKCIEITGVYLEKLFCVDYFNMVMSQSGIDNYNSIIGGYVTEDGTKIQGLNEYINLYNQQV